MIEFFSRAQANIARGSLSSLRDLLEGFRQQQVNSVVEINFEKHGWIYILLLNGETVGAYHLTDRSSNTIAVSNPEQWWQGESATIRTLNLPTNALRIISMACEWHPPAQSLLIQSSGLPGVLRVFLENKTSGLLHVIDSAGELAVPLMDGYPVAGEAVYSAAQMTSGRQALERGLQPASNNCTVRLYEARPGTTSFKQLVLRQVVAEMTGNVLTRYNRIVGSNLLRVMGNEMNQVLRYNRLQMQFVGEQFDNSHIFRSMDEATRSYNVLFRALYMHMTQVIGGGLAGKLQKEAYHNLNPRSQVAIDAQSILNTAHW